MVDAADRLSYALIGDVSADPTVFKDARGDLTRIIDLLRGRAMPTGDELHWEPAVDTSTGLVHPRRSQRLQNFMNRPAIVAGVMDEVSRCLPGRTDAWLLEDPQRLLLDV